MCSMSRCSKVPLLEVDQCCITENPDLGLPRSPQIQPLSAGLSSFATQIEKPPWTRSDQHQTRQSSPHTTRNDGPDLAKPKTGRPRAIFPRSM